LETYKNLLKTQKSEEDARREYEYDSRKNLYVEFEPLLFQLNELSDRAYRRIIGLVRDFRNGNLEPHRGWLSDDNSYFPYYSTATLHALLAPLGIFKLMSRRLTLYDLNLDTSFRNQYLLAKFVYRSFTLDFKLANSGYRIYYDPIIPKLKIHKKNLLTLIEDKAFI
jgi:hypothetical protein